ncbi:hypothetical protein ACIO93_36405 [Streptomyces sp. NPDC087903]|uniref:hypothetical protein n=1 Tax=Streptomyces sp. NPDC087903 TaxID=3365819 RepID=UPI0038264B64
MAHTQIHGDAGRTEGVCLLFAHEPYYPNLGTQETNTTLVAAASLLHPRVRQPDGAQMLSSGRHDLRFVRLALALLGTGARQTLLGA